MKHFKVIIITVLTVLNIMLIYINTENQNQIENLRSQIQSENYLSIDNIRVTYDQIDIPDSDLFLLVFFTNQGCISCIKNEIRNLNILYKEYDKNVRVYIKGDDKSYFEQFYLTFPIYTINSFETIFDNKLGFKNPVALLMDSNGMVQYINVAETGNPVKSNQFYRRVNSLFKLIN